MSQRPKWITSFRSSQVGRMIERTYRRFARRTIVTKPTVRPDTVSRPEPTREDIQHIQTILGIDDVQARRIVEISRWLRRHDQERQRIWNELETKRNPRRGAG